MADALISKEHFYLNGSVYAEIDNQDAVIEIEDTNDILQSNDDWLVHVTRFSCDAMKSLTYAEKDERWEDALGHSEVDIAQNAPLVVHSQRHAGDRSDVAHDHAESDR